MNLRRLAWLGVALLGCGATGTASAKTPSGEADGATSILLGPQGAMVTMRRDVAWAEGQDKVVLTGLPPGLEAGTLTVEGISGLKQVRVRSHAAETKDLLGDFHGRDVLVEPTPGASPIPVRIGGHPERTLFKIGDTWTPELPGRLLLPELPPRAFGTTLELQRVDRRRVLSTATLRFHDARSRWQPEMRLSLDRSGSRGRLEAWAVVSWASGGYGPSSRLELVVQPTRPPVPWWPLARTAEAADSSSPTLEPEGGLWRLAWPELVDSRIPGQLRLPIGLKEEIQVDTTHMLEFAVPWESWDLRETRKATLRAEVGGASGPGFPCPPGPWTVTRADAAGVPLPLARTAGEATPADDPLQLNLGLSLDVSGTMRQSEVTDDAEGRRVVTMKGSVHNAGKESVRLELTLRADSGGTWVKGQPEPDAKAPGIARWKLSLAPGARRTLEASFRRPSPVNRPGAPWPAP